VPISSIDLGSQARIGTGLGELDRVLGGGLVPGSVVLLAGEPGVGKSTLMLQAAAGLEAQGRRVVLFCGEESLDQVAARAARLGGPKLLHLCGATHIAEIAPLLAQADIAVVDSVQTLFDPETSGQAGSVSQVRSCAAQLSAAAKAVQTVLILIGHVTKDGSVAGPRTLEHVVDVVLTFDGDRGQFLRTVRGVKNRFGPTAELGVFEMGAQGLKEVSDASSLFLGDRRAGIPGSAVGCVLEGRRALALEIQALAMETGASVPRRVTQGLDSSRLGVVLAVLQSRAGVPLGGYEVYASVAGGLRASEPGIDLALALALASARLARTVPADTAAFGEVGLGGEIRSVPGAELRIGELARLGFKRLLVPASTVVESSSVSKTGPSSGPLANGSIEILPVKDLSRAVALLDQL